MWDLIRKFLQIYNFEGLPFHSFRHFTFYNLFLNVLATKTYYKINIFWFMLMVIMKNSWRYELEIEGVNIYEKHYRR